MYFNKNSVIAIIDSGIGGISILKQLIKKYNSGNYIYFADNLYMPYGNKSKSFVKKRVETVIDILIKQYNVDYVIVACNTASSCIDLNKYKNVYAMTFNKDVTYLSTTLTKANVDHKNMLAEKNLAKSIEKYILANPTKLEQTIKAIVQKNNLTKLDSLCLGCTHYELVHSIFKELCPNTTIINNSSFIIDDININATNELNVLFLTSRQSYTYINKLSKLTFN